MPRTQLSGGEVLDQSIKRADLNVSEAGKAVIVRAVGSTNVTLSSTGVDTGTGDVTFDLSTTGVGAGTYTKVQVDVYGRVISSSSLATSDIPSGVTHYVWNQVASVQSAGFSISGNAHVGSVRMWNTANTFYVGLQSPTGQASNVTFTLPGSLGSNGQALTSDGSGGLVWSDLSYVPLVGNATITRASDANHLYFFRNANTVTDSSSLTFDVLNASSARVNAGRVINALRDNTAGAHHGAIVVAAARAGAMQNYVSIGTNASGNEGVDVLRGGLYFQNDTSVLRDSANVVRTPGKLYVGNTTTLYGAFVANGGSITAGLNGIYKTLIHFEGANGSRRFLNSGIGGDTIYTRGTNYYSVPTISTAQKKFGASSALFAGAQWLEVGFKTNIGTADFTFDFHIRFTSIAGTQTIFDVGGSTSGVVLTYASGVWTLTVAGTACTFSQTPTAGTWYHIGMSRTSGSVRFFVAGTKTGTTQNASGSCSTSTSNMFLGATSSGTNSVTAYIDELRVLVTWSAYQSDSNITVPSAPYDPFGLHMTTNEATPQAFEGKTLVGDGAGNFMPQRPPRVVSLTFALTENVANTTKYFYAHRGAGNTQEDNKRSGNASGFGYANSCTPAQCPINGRITNAVLVIQGAGVNNGSVTYPVLYRADVFRVGFAAEHDPNINGGSPATLNFPINSGVGLYSIGTTDTRVELNDLNIAVNAGDPIGLKFINGSGASQAAICTMAFVTLTIEETF